MSGSDINFGLIAVENIRDRIWAGPIWTTTSSGPIDRGRRGTDREA